MPFQKSINWYHPDAAQWRDWPEGTDPNAAPAQFARGRDHTVTQTCLRLRNHGFNVRLSNRLTPGAVNVIHLDDLRLGLLPFRSFVVVVRNDRFAPSLGNLTVVNRPALAETPRDYFVKCYTQTGMQPRDPQRGDTVRNVGFFGLRKNMAPVFQSAEFEAALAERGLRLIIRESDWEDYRDIDVVLAVRTHLAARIRAVKPPLKLLNAWRAGVPALLGPEPGYRELRQDPLDYIEIRTPQQALAALDNFTRHPNTYAAIREHGWQRAAAFRDDEVTNDWIRFLSGPVAIAYERWRRFAWLKTPRRIVRAIRAARQQRRDYAAWWDQSQWFVDGPNITEPDPTTISERDKIRALQSPAAAPLLTPMLAGVGRETGRES